jgi:hypothetical protein
VSQLTLGNANLYKNFAKKRKKTTLVNHKSLRSEIYVQDKKQDGCKNRPLKEIVSQVVVKFLLPRGGEEKRDYG